MLGRLLLVLFVGCIDDGTIVCGELRCPAGNVCTQAGCATAEQATACDGVADGEACKAPVIGICGGGACHVVVCGDLRVDPGEACDDGNTIDGDGCAATCLSDETCGNGVTDTSRGEQCDDDIANTSSDGCTSTCRIEIASWRDATPGTIAGRGDLGLAFDSDRHRVVLFGGFAEAGTFGDLWEFDGNDWFERTPPLGPTPRAGHAMVYDAARHVVVVFGGSTDNGNVAETWTWDGTSWTQHTPALSPPARSETAATYDSARQRVVLFGGSGGFADTWEWDGTTWIDKTPATSPPPITKAALAYDAKRNVTVLFGGLTRETWEWNGSTWSQKSPATVPAPDIYAQAAYDPVRERVVMYGGYASGSLSTTVYEYDGVDWTAIPTSGVPGRTIFGMDYDADRAKVIIFGGYSSNATNVIMLGDTAHWNGSTWAPFTAPAQSPPGRGYAGFAYDRRHGRSVLFGGWVSSMIFADTWILAHGRWRQVLGPAPSGRSAVGMAYDDARDQIVLFGGEDGAVFGDTWVWNDTGWTKLTPAGPTPAARSAHQLVYDTRRGKTVLFGGYLGPGSRSNETWEWDGTSWHLMSPPTAPSGRYAFAMAYDESRGRTVMFGGLVPGGLTDETWEYDGTTWTQLHPAVSPRGRSYPVMAYDPLRRRIVMATGYDELSHVVGDVWEWDGAAWEQVPAFGLPVRYAAVMAYDAIARRLTIANGFSFVSDTLTDTWRLGYDTPFVAAERCLLAGEDRDGDGLAGCADPDCWGRCDPLCTPPLAASCDPARPRCGDGACNAALEDSQLCPVDCP